MSEGAAGVGAADDVVARAWRVLGEVLDPELGLDVVSLGLVYDVRDDPARARVHVEMTLTTPGCPVSEQLPYQAAEMLRRNGIDAEVVVVWDPPWSPERMTPEALARLGFGRAR